MIERSICPLTMLVKRSMLTVRIERSICPLAMLVERSMLTMRFERSICPLTILQYVKHYAIATCQARHTPQ